jgi:predicted ABC-class ATPase
MTEGSADELRQLLLRIDGKGYKAYKQIKGRWRFPDFLLSVDHVQGDPFAAPSPVSVFLGPEVAALPSGARTPGGRAVGAACFLARRFSEEARGAPRGRGTGKSGEIRIDAPGQEVLPQTAVRVDPDGSLEARFTVGLPARGRRVTGGEAAKLLTATVPNIVRASLRAGPVDPAAILLHAEVNEDADALREGLEEMELVAFVADGAILPRASGISQEPLGAGEAVPFHSPDSLRVEVELPNAGTITGMGVPRGVTLIVGGGYHGKSTLLRAVERGVYNHRPGDGRERVVSDPSTVKIRAEDGRSVEKVDISAFIGDLPTGEDTRVFSSANASGSTSQAANIMEAMEAGARVLLVDEDTAATNFMIRDRRMQALVPREREPITPFVDRVRQLYEGHQTSSILVLGGSGDYLDVADTVIAMTEYRPSDVSQEGRQVATAHPTGREPESVTPLRPLPPRIPLPSSLDPRRGRKGEYLRVHDVSTLRVGREEIDISSLEQVVSRSQAHAIGRALLMLAGGEMEGSRSLVELLDLVEGRIEDKGLDVLDSRKPGDLAWFRRFELAAALNRVRTLAVGG